MLLPGKQQTELILPVLTTPIFWGMAFVCYTKYYSCNAYLKCPQHHCFLSFKAAVCNWLLQLNQLKKVLHADMQLSTWSTNDCWSAHSTLPAMDGLTQHWQSYTYKQKLQDCEPLDLSRFVVDLRERHLEYWTPYSDTQARQMSRRMQLGLCIAPWYDTTCRDYKRRIRWNKNTQPTFC